MTSVPGLIAPPDEGTIPAPGWVYKIRNSEHGGYLSFVDNGSGTPTLQVLGRAGLANRKEGAARWHCIEQGGWLIFELMNDDKGSAVAKTTPGTVAISYKHLSPQSQMDKGQCHFTTVPLVGSLSMSDGGCGLRFPHFLPNTGPVQLWSVGVRDDGHCSLDWV